MSNAFISWSATAFVSIVLWLLAYVGQTQTTIYPPRAIEPPQWLTYLAARPKQQRLDVHCLAQQVLAMSMLIAYTILVFTIELRTDRLMYFFLIIAGMMIFLVPVIFILKYLYGVKAE